MTVQRLLAPRAMHKSRSAGSLISARRNTLVLSVWHIYLTVLLKLNRGAIQLPTMFREVGFAIEKSIRVHWYGTIHYTIPYNEKANLKFQGIQLRLFIALYFICTRAIILVAA